MECSSCLIGSLEARSARFCSLACRLHGERDRLARVSGTVRRPERHAARHDARRGLVARLHADGVSAVRDDPRLHADRAGRHRRRAARDALRHPAEHLPPPERRPPTAPSARVDSATDLRVIDTTIGQADGAGHGRRVRRRHHRRRFPTAALVPLFRPDRLIGIADVRGRRHHGHAAAADRQCRSCSRRRRRARGCASGSASARPRRAAQVAGSVFAPRLTFRVSPDTLVPRTRCCSCRRRRRGKRIATRLRDVSHRRLRRSPIPGSGVLAVGGVAGARTYSVRRPADPRRFGAGDPRVAAPETRCSRASWRRASDTWRMLVNPDPRRLADHRCRH